jgi:hypothetical protein
VQAFPGVIDYEHAVSYPAPYRVGLFHCADVLIHAPSQEVRNQFMWLATRLELGSSPHFPS